MLGEIELFYPYDPMLGAFYMTSISSKPINYWSLSHSMFKNLLQIHEFSLWVAKSLANKIRLTDQSIIQLEQLRYNLLEAILDKFSAVKNSMSPHESNSQARPITFSKAELETFSPIPSKTNQALNYIGRTIKSRIERQYVQTTNSSQRSKVFYCTCNNIFEELQHSSYPSLEIKFRRNCKTCNKRSIHCPFSHKTHE